jgi:hypothetical protein
MEISVPNFLLDLCDKKNNLSYNGYNYSLNPNFFFEYKMIPLFTGMTSKETGIFRRSKISYRSWQQSIFLIFRIQCRNTCQKANKGGDYGNTGIRSKNHSPA